MRTPTAAIAQYHTSDDNLDFISSEALAESYQIISSILRFLNTTENSSISVLAANPNSASAACTTGIAGRNLALLWVLNFSDGTFSLLDIAERAKMPFKWIKRASERLIKAGLLRRLVEND